jgi:hypothetical protein
MKPIKPIKPINQRMYLSIAASGSHERAFFSQNGRRSHFFVMVDNSFQIEAKLIMDDDIKMDYNIKLDDDLTFLENRKQPNFVCYWKTTSIF